MRWLHSIASLLPLLATLSPLIGAMTVLVMARRSEQLLPPIARANATVTVLLIGTALWQFDPQQHDDRGRFVARQMKADVSLHREASPGIDVRLAFGFDGLAGWPALLIALSVWAAMRSHRPTNGRSFATHAFWMFVCETCLIGSFMASDAIMSLALFEAALFPICFAMGSIGTESQRGAATRLWAYQFVGCGLSLLGTTMLAVSRPWMQSDMSARRDSLWFDAATLGERLQLLLPRSETAVHLWSHLAPWCVPLLFLGMALRLPVFPFHVWYRSAVINAPPGVAAVIAVALPTAALNGWLRIGMPMIAIQSSALTLFVSVLALVGALHAGIMAQKDQTLKELVATASSGMFCLSMLCLCLPTRSGLFGAWLTVVSQGVAVAAVCLAMNDSELTSEDHGLPRCEGLTNRRPRLAALLVVLLLCWMGVPFLGGLTGSILVLSSSLSWGLLVASSAIGATLLIAIAALRVMCGILAHGETRKNPEVRSSVSANSREERPNLAVPLEELPAGSEHRSEQPVPIEQRDLRWHELMVLVPFLTFLIVINVAPSLITTSCEIALTRLLERSERTEMRKSTTDSSDALRSRMVTNKSE